VSTPDRQVAAVYFTATKVGVDATCVDDVANFRPTFRPGSLIVAALGTAPLDTQLPMATFFSVFLEIKVSEERAPCKLQAHSPGTLGVGRAISHINQIFASSQ
jgi:hypothetical protein